MPGFVHLHVHTQYSILDGAIRLGNDHHLPVPDLISEISKRPVKAVALTDHGVMHGIVDFIDRSKKPASNPLSDANSISPTCIQTTPKKSTI